MSEFLTVTEAAKLLGVTRGAVHGHIKRGNLPVIRIGKAGFAITRIELLDFIERRAVKRAQESVQ